MLKALLGLLSVDRLIAITGLGHSIVSSIKQDKRDNALHAILAATHEEVRRLSSSVLYLPSVTEVRRLEHGLESQIHEMGELREALRPVQRALGGAIISTSAMRAPGQLRKALRQDPWEVLFDIRPLSRPQAHLEPSMIPFLFQEGGEHYLGWQKRGIMPALLGLEFSESELLSHEHPPHAVIQYENLGRSQRYLMFKDEIIVGRKSPDVWADLRIDADPNVSRQHVCIQRTPERGFRLKDISKLGTRINGEWVPSSAIRIGELTWEQDRWIELPSRAWIALAENCLLDFRALA